MRQRVRVFPLRFQGFPQSELVFEVAGIQGGGALQVRNAEAGILLQPIRSAQMILRRRELRVQIEGALEALDGLLAAVQDSQQKAHFILQMRRLGIQPGRPLVDRQRAGGVTLGLQRRAAILQILHRIGSVTHRTEPEERHEKSHSALLYWTVGVGL